MKKKYVATSKDKKDWMDFAKKIDNISTKEVDLLQENIQINRVPKLDLHGLSLNVANREVKEFINESFYQGYRKLLIITGKGLRSKVDENPYISEKFSVLKYSVPQFIKNEENLNKKVMKILTADKKHGGNGAIYIFLKNKKKLENKF